MMSEHWPALSLREPWLTAVLDLGKRIENRRWNANYRGRFWLHTAKGMTRREYEEGCGFIEREVGVQPPPRSQLRPQGIAGAATIVGSIPPRCTNSGWLRELNAFANRYPGLECRWWMDEQVGFVLVDVVTLPIVVPCAGRLGFFQLPPDVEQAAREALPR